MVKTDRPLIKPTSDVFIAMFLSAPKNEPCLRSLINAVLKDKSGRNPIEKAIVLNPFNMTDYVVDKQIVLDVRVADCSGCAFNIEIQTYPHPAFRERILYGWSDSYSSQLSIGINFKELRPVITIVITEFAVIPKSQDVHLVFELRERDNHNLLLSEHIQIHIWQLHEIMKGHDHVLQAVSPDLAHWSQFLAHGGMKSEEEMATLTENDPKIIEAHREFLRFNSDPQTRELARRRHLFLVDQYLAQAAFKAEGREEGLVEGRAEGRAEGFAESEAKHLADKIEIARKLKSCGLKNESIMEITGLSFDQIIDLE
ncbi:MAG: Rpn family recombination-promoting nuclease/putative transposase [Planctomycetaceae bacterium]|jgi:predicted transposase/invertase (TIGR01784 family)|nr:Rpn family recombination-promoting nuclease/putative transposase [Planctomycetaceae bacterium]